MAKRGRWYVFHGAFGTKAKARRKERRRKGAFIREVLIRGKKRYLVMTEK